MRHKSEVKEVSKQLAAVRPLDRDAIIIGAGVAGIYQLKRLLDMGVNAVAIEANSDLGGTWFNNRYPGARFDSESFTYGFSFSKEVLDEWHWKERFSPQPENLKYLNFVADKFDLRPHMEFNVRLVSASFDETASVWTTVYDDGREFVSRFLILAVGLLSVPIVPRFAGRERFKGRQFHTFDWPHSPVDLRGQKVAVIGTGATGIQVISAIAEDVESLTVFQRRPNWAAPLHNSPITLEEMADIRSRYREIFARCASTPGGFVHGPDPRPYSELTPEERVATWERLYDEPGFGIWLSNFMETFTDEEVNADLSEFVAAKTRARIKDPKIADRLIPKDHGFGMQRVPLETKYFEVYNRPNVELVDLLETPIETLTEQGLKTTDREFEFDYIVYATGFDAITGAFDKIRIEGKDGRLLSDEWSGTPSTFYGLLARGFPNLMFATGPQSASGSTNYPRGIELNVNWISNLIEYMVANDLVAVEPSAVAEKAWVDHVVEIYGMVLLRKGKSWFTGYNSNIPGRDTDVTRYLVYNGGAHRFAYRIKSEEAGGYKSLEFNGAPSVIESQARSTSSVGSQ